MVDKNKKTYLERSQECIAQGALTNSKRPESFVKGVYPTHIKSGKGCYLTDVEGKDYIDFICGLGCNLLGYDYLDSESFKQQIRFGVSHSLPSTSEIEFAEELKSMFPFIEKIKILKSGSDGCSAAVRIARAYNRRDLLLSDGYHGYHSEFISVTPPAYGVPSAHGEWINKLDGNFDLFNCHDLVSAVIVEPIITDWSEQRKAFLLGLKQQCTANGILLIFDETITALRFPGFSVAQYWGIEPDLIIFGKALANGLPISIVGGKKKIMDCDYFVSTTFAGDRMSIEAARMVLSTLRDGKLVQSMWNEGKAFLERFNAISPLVQIEGYPTRGVFKGSELHKALFFQEACRAGILFGPSWFWCSHHNLVVDRVINICQDILTRIASNQVKLEGEMPVKPFAQKVREG